jgi:hypothetical protein
MDPKYDVPYISLNWETVAVEMEDEVVAVIVCAEEDAPKGARHVEINVSSIVTGETNAAITMSEAEVDALISSLKAAKAAAWPKPLKPLCPASRELLAYLRQHQNITPIKAREELGIEHLPRRIKDLKEHGHRIKTIRKRGYAGKLYGRYELEGGA